MIFHAILERDPVPPVRLNPDLPPKLEDIINKALEKDRNLRYQIAAEMRADLQRLKRDTETGRAVAVGALAGSLGDSQGTPDKPPPGPALSQGRWQRAPKEIGGRLRASALALVAIALLTFRLTVPLPPPRSRAMSSLRTMVGPNSGLDSR